MTTPIAFFAHKRPKHLEAALEFIHRSQAYLDAPLPIYIFCDAAAKPEDAEGVEQVCAVAEKWAAPERIVKREKNRGFRNIVDGVSQLCEAYGQVIVIEDDVLVSPDFLPYITRALEAYADAASVYAITGFNYHGQNPQSPTLFFQRHLFCWGWATWQRAWSQFQWDHPDWQQTLAQKKFRHDYNIFGMYPFTKMVEKTFQNKWTSWAVRGDFTFFKKGGLVLTPYHSLVWNCGAGGGTHGDSWRDQSIFDGEREHYIHGDMCLEEFKKPRLPQQYTFPPKPSLNKKAYRQLGLNLLAQRIRVEKRKKWRRKLKWWYHTILLHLPV